MLALSMLPKMFFFSAIRMQSITRVSSILCFICLHSARVIVPSRSFFLLISPFTLFDCRKYVSATDALTWIGRYQL